MQAAYKGHKEIVETLIAAGADPNLQNEVRPRMAMVLTVILSPL